MDIVQATAGADDLLRRAGMLIDAGRAAAARPLLAAARRMAPGSPDMALLAARLALQDGTPDVACAELDAAIDAAPEHAGLRKLRADMRQRMGDLDGATRDAAEAVILDREDPAAKALLGTLMLEIGRSHDALSCLTEAVRAAPREPAFRGALAAAQEACQDPGAALRTLEEGIAASPLAVSLRGAAAMLCVRQRDFTGAVRLAEQARKDGAADACLFGLMGHALSSLGRHEQAAEAYAEALKLGPDDPYVRHLVAAAGARPGANRAPPAYVRAVFDGYSDRFEEHLISLGYRVPGLIRRVLLDHPQIRVGKHAGPVLDLGCGTGLVALVAGDLSVGPFTGIDVSAGMLERARAKGLYAALREADLMTALAEDDQSWPLVIAADVFCYFGVLDELLPAIFARLAPGGWLVSSIETLLPDQGGAVPGNGNWALLRQGRYAHAEAYVRRAAAGAGFAIRHLTPEVLRFEAGAPVEGMILVLERAPADG